MNFEVLKKNHLKRNILVGVGVIVIVSACILTFSLAKYRNTKSIQIAKGTINYSFADLNILAIYQEDESGGYSEITRMPESGYSINEEKSYCEVNGAKDSNVSIYTNSIGEHVIAKIQKGSKCYLYFDKNTKIVNTVLGAIEVILREPDFSKTSCSNGCGENTTGIFEETTSEGTTFFYRGDVDNNWVYFAGFYWRIIRINEDGTVRMIYNGTTTDQTGTTTQIKTASFNSNNDRAEYVGLKYTEGSQHGTETDSTIMTELNIWYSNNLASYADSIDTNAGFCGDRNIVEGVWNSQADHELRHTGYARLIMTRTPSLECSSEDLFTATNASKGNKSLINPIGLITVDEIMYAGGIYNLGNTNYYLYTGQIYWTMTPTWWNSSTAYVFIMNNNGAMNGGNVINSFAIRPVINLRADVKFTGTGASTDPFKVS